MQTLSQVVVTRKFDDGRGIRMPHRLFYVPAHIADIWVTAGVACRSTPKSLSSSKKPVRKYRNKAHK